MKNKCPFCGSEKLKIETPYVKGSGEKIFEYCCLAQKKNDTFAAKRFGKENKPSLEEVSKW